MLVNEVLDKLTMHNAGVIGCMATGKNRLHHNLRDAYAVLDAGMICEEAEMMFELMDGLDDPSPHAEYVFMEMRGHSVFARRLDDGVLVVLNKPVDRRVFKQMQVGVNLFIKPLSKAIATHGEAAPAPAAPVAAATAPVAAAAAPEAAPTGKKRRFYRGVEY